VGNYLTLDEEQSREVLKLLEGWAYGHPKKDLPFLILMGRILTPVQFYKEVADGTDFGASFLRFLAEQSRRSEEPPTAFLQRAIQANRV